MVQESSEGHRSLVERLGRASDARLVIINADDMGMCHSANEGTYSALRDGIATSASLMVPCPWAKEAAARYRGEDVGVHLTLTAEFEHYRWGPCTQAPSLLGGDGGFPRTVADCWDHADLDESRRELRAQVERAILWGFDVTHLDSHMGVLAFRPEFFDIYLDLAVAFELPIRLPNRSREHDAGFPFRDLAEQEGMVMPDRLLHAAHSAARGGIEQVIADLKPGVTEISFLPATDNPELRSLADDWASRVEHHDLLVRDSELRETIRRSGAELIGWRELRALQRSGG
jgi:predicted glycoside hydrolase/deacetylase ChbG (UPF0249 family)